RCRAMLAPSLWWEPLGLVTYEAYDYGKPMLAARSGGLSETVVHGKTGFLHTPGNVNSLVDSLLHLESMSETERAAMGGAGREWLLANTSVAQWRRRFNEVLQSAVGVGS
ncbi:MAG: glycosyltransferase, partial [Proteobacteria bacterium]|nr:glycosyltransferase [Pseudomonadota bacterium]